jgi:S-DNA-T family DNA segregation ATPase FtsK/SpoIIIE
VNRRARRARHRLRRGEARHEPLLVVSDDGSHLVDGAAMLARAGFRYRSELAPLLVASALWLGALVLRGARVAPVWVAVVAVAVAAGVAWPRVTPLWRPIERAYAAALLLTGGGWAAVATAVGADVAPVPLVLIIATIVGALPWWAHRRRRAKVQVERTLDAWPEISAAVGMPGSRVMSAVVDRWGWRARVGLPRGRTATELINSTPALESGLRTRPGAVRVEPDPDRADHALVRVLTADPHAQPVPTRRTGRPASASPTRCRWGCSRTPSPSPSGSRTGTGSSEASPGRARAVS